MIKKDNKIGLKKSLIVEKSGSNLIKAGFKKLKDILK